MSRLARSFSLRTCLALAVGVVIFTVFSHLPFLTFILLNFHWKEDIEVFSSRKSPGGAYDAESVMVGANTPVDPGGRIVIRAKDGSEQNIDLGTTAPDVFFRWTDGSHLELWTERHPLYLHGVARVGDVSLLARTYDFPRNASYDRPSSRTITVPVQDVVTSFQGSKEGIEGAKRTCILSIAATHGPFDPASVEIKATVNPQTGKETRPRLYINTRFNLEGVRDKSPQTLLTSATIANLGSYNRLPDGKDGTAIRGQFLGKSALGLMLAISGPSITIDFSRDFFAEVLRYNIPMTGSAATDFRQCVGQADPS